MTTLIVLTDLVEKLVLVVLLCLSIWSMTIVIDRRRILKNEANLDFFNKLKNLLENNQLAEFATLLSQGFQGQNMLAGALRRALENSSTPQSIDRAVSSYVTADKIRLEKGLAILGTLGANAPFIGLFGTVLGIIRAFAYLGTQGGSAAVMSGVSQALYATALGLMVAIPAVVFFNIFTKQIRNSVVWTEALRDLYVAKKKW
ncbi:MAG: MotA/TolQ/ExbB proton channel family protein [Bdellovibrionaceae bacterium]|nr:MotA/TolQ/ExbB proton channel family protein [Pseudobdellovibrionaceae bacterium]